jgi:uncharacterized protein (TIGR03086 family)
MDTTELHRRAVEVWRSTVAGVGDEQWEAATPCSDWDVRALVNHVVGEDLWTRPLVEGQTIEEVGDRFDGDVLGGDPRASAESAATDAVESMAAKLPEGGDVHLSFGDFPVSEYCNQLIADHTVHSWDLAAATGQDRTMDPELVAAVAPWFDNAEQVMRDGGAIGPKVEEGDDPQSELLGRFGRSADWSAS